MPTLALAPVHWRAASLFASKDQTKAHSAIYVEPAGEAKVRLVAVDGPGAIAMRVRALHDLVGPMLIRPLSANPKAGELVSYTTVEFDPRAAEEHPLFATPELLARPFIEASKDGGVVNVDPLQLERLVRAAKLLGHRCCCSPNLPTSPAWPA